MKDGWAAMRAALVEAAPRYGLTAAQAVAALQADEFLAQSLADDLERSEGNGQAVGLAARLLLANAGYDYGGQGG